MKQIIIRGAIIAAVSGMFAVPASAEDTGLINALNAQTRAQVTAHKAEILRKRAEEGRTGAGSVGAGIRG